MLRKLIGLMGLLTLVFVIANVHFGAVTPYIVEGAPNSRIDVLRLADPGCTVPEMEKEISETGSAFCLSESGTWGTADIMLLCWGLLIITAGRFRMPSNPKLARRIRRVMMISGSMLFGLAILDRFELLPTGADSDTLSDLVPLPLSAWQLQIIMAIAGALLLRGPKYHVSEFEENYRSLESEREKELRMQQVFNQKARDMAASNEGIAKRSRLLDRDASLVPFRTRTSPRVRATCPYCKGGGCKECRMTGVV